MNRAPLDESESPRPHTPRAVWVALAVLALLLALATHSVPGSWADASRLATIESVVERGTLAIDESTYFWQGDKVRFDGLYYSHQPPMLALLGALPYALLHHLGGLSIDSAHVYRTLTLCLTGLPVWLGLWALARLCLAAGTGPRWTALLVATAGLATLLLPWSLVLNQHGTAAGLVLLGFAALNDERPALAGLLLALASTIDLTAMFPAAAAIWAALAEHRETGLARYVLGALPVLALHFAINWAVAGNLVPFGMHDEAFEYPMSPFLLMSLTGVEQELLSPERAVYLFGATFGASGLFSHHPILLAAVVAGLALLGGWRRRTGNLAAGILPAAALGSLGITGFYLVQSNNFGGSAFGMRWFAVFAPLLLLFPAAWLARHPDWRPSRAAAGLLGFLWLWSAAGAALGAVNPWTKFHYRYADSPEGRTALPGEPRPSAIEHWRAEWERMHLREPVTREWYDQTYARMLDQHRRLYLGPTPWLDEAGRRAWIGEGLARLHRVVDLLDADRTPVYSRVMGHFWLGKFYAELEDRAAAEREYLQTLTLAPTHAPATKALERLRAGEVNGGR